MISYENINMRTKQVKTHKYDPETDKRTKLKNPIVTYTNHIVDGTAYDLGILYKMIDYASDVGYNVEVTFTINREY